MCYTRLKLALLLLKAVLVNFPIGTTVSSLINLIDILEIFFASHFIELLSFDNFFQSSILTLPFPVCFTDLVDENQRFLLRGAGGKDPDLDVVDGVVSAAAVAGAAGDIYPSVDPETQAKLEALFETAGIGKLSGETKQFTDPEVRRKCLKISSNAYIQWRLIKKKQYPLYEPKWEHFEIK